MKLTRLTALVLALAMALSMVSMASAEEKPSTWISDELVEITIMRDENPSQIVTTDNIKLQTIEELLNVRIIVEAPPKASYTDKKATRIATDDMPDIMLVDFTTDVMTYADDGMFVNLSDYRDQMPNLFALLDSNPSCATVTINGDYYHAPSLQRVNPDARRSGQLINIRTDLLEKYNIPTPTTWDELHDAILTIQQNEPGMVGFTNRKGGSTTGTRKMLDCMAYPLGSGSTMYYDEDLGGVWVYGPAHENFKAVLTYLNKCYESGVLDPDYAIMTKDLWTEKLSSGRAICTIDNDGVVRNFNVALQTVDPSAEIGIIPTLTNSLGQTRNTYYTEDKITSAWVISASSEHIDVCVKFLDWCYSEQGTDVNGYGKEGVTFDYVDGHPVLKEEVMAKYAANGSTAAYDLQSALGIGLLDISPRYDTGAENQMELYMMGSEEAVAEYKAKLANIVNDTNLRAPVTSPALTLEQAERYNELLVAVENIIWQEVDKYITGQEPIENWDKVMEKARKAGAEEMEKIYNDAWAALQGK